MRRVAQMRHMRNHPGTDAVQETEALVADGNRLRRHACALQFAQLGGDAAQHIGVQSATQTLVGRHDNEAGVLRLVLLHERVRVFRVGLAEVGGNVADLLAVRTGGAHALLRLAHLGCGHHFHGLGDLLGVLHRFDLAAYFLTYCHKCS